MFQDLSTTRIDVDVLVKDTMFYRFCLPASVRSMCFMIVLPISN